MTLAIDRVARLAAPTLRKGYTQRDYRPGDEAGWRDLLVGCGFDEWSREMDMAEYLRDPGRREGSSVVVRGERIVAATFASRQDAVGSPGAANRDMILEEMSQV